MRPNPSQRRRLPIVLSVAVSMIAYVVFPGCGMFPSAPARSVAPDPLQPANARTALSFLEEKKRRGELPGLAPGDAGHFSTTWLFNHQHRPGGYRMRCTFTFADGRPERHYEIVDVHGWRLVPPQQKPR